MVILRARWWGLGVLPLLLVACSPAPEAPKLAGPRLDITLQPTVLQASAAASLVPFQLPKAEPLANWAQSGANASHTPGHVALPTQVARAWTYSLGRSRNGLLLNPPVVHSGRVFAMNTEGEVVALNAATGKEIWTRELPLTEPEQAALAGGVAVSGNVLFATTGDGQVFALTADKGVIVWQVALKVPLRAAPTIDGEQLYLTSHDNRLFVLSALNGSLLWTHSGMSEALSLIQAASPAVANGLVLVPYSSGELFALRATDGRFVWSDTLASSFSGQDPESTLSALAAPPVVADGLVYAMGLNGGLSAYVLATGQRVWKADVLGSQMPLVAGAQMFALTDAGELVCLNRADAGVRWVQNLNSYVPKAEQARQWQGPLLAGNRLIVVSDDGYAVSVNPENGAKLVATQVDEAISLPPVVTSDGLYFLTDAGKIVAFRPGKAE
jgi:outer membrane protein assembly factor BamB